MKVDFSILTRDVDLVSQRHQMSALDNSQSQMLLSEAAEPEIKWRMTRVTPSVIRNVSDEEVQMVNYVKC